MLTAIKIKILKPRDKIYRVSDGAGLYLEVHPNGSKYWRQKYRFSGKEKRLAHGIYGTGGGKVSLAQARAKVSEAKELLGRGKDPGELKKLSKISRHNVEENGFEAVAREWISKQSPIWSEGHTKRIILLLVNNVFPWLGDYRIKLLFHDTLFIIGGCLWCLFNY